MPRNKITTTCWQPNTGMTGPEGFPARSGPGRALAGAEADFCCRRFAPANASLSPDRAGECSRPVVPVLGCQQHSAGMAATWSALQPWRIGPPSVTLLRIRGVVAGPKQTRAVVAGAFPAPTHPPTHPPTMERRGSGGRHPPWRGPVRVQQKPDSVGRARVNKGPYVKRLFHKRPGGKPRKVSGAGGFGGAAALPERSRRKIQKISEAVPATCY